jgi:hypothetical protein
VDPTCQTPRAAPCSSHALKALSGPRAPASRQRRLAPRARRPTASRAPPLASPTALLSRPSRRPDRCGPKPPTARPSTSRHAAIPAPVSRPFLGHLLCASVVPPLARRAAPPPPHAKSPCAARCAGRASAVSTGRTPRGRGPCARVAAGHAHTVRLGRARFRPSGTRFKFYIF